MYKESTYNRFNWPTGLNIPRETAVAIILLVALFAFEIFNFDTTQYALRNLLGDVSFAGLRWASILAIAFCAIDFAGLAHLFTPEKGQDEPREVWYLMGAWLIGATMNALMTWWAVSLTLLNHDLGNEVLSREQLLHGAPIFVAVVVWLVRILFIGSMSVAGEHLFRPRHEAAPARSRTRKRAGSRVSRRPQPALAAAPRNAAPRTAAPQRAASRGRVQLARQTDDVPPFMESYGRASPTMRAKAPAAEPIPVEPAPQREHRRVRQRPPQPAPGRRTPATMRANGRRR